MMETEQFSFGDRVVHAERPEWGTGTVTAAAPATVDGQRVQRLTIRFERAGLKTLSSHIADLRPADQHEAPAQGVASTNGEGGWLETLEAGDVQERMARLPEVVLDPFMSLRERIKATLHLYRFSDEGGPLLDWASTQTGLKDPLSRFSRHELEQLFRRYATNRDSHLASLLLEAKRKEPALLKQAVAAAPPSARSVVKRFNAGR